MTLIDQRILIDAPIAVVWDHLADPDKLARWHMGYTSISILTTHRAGAGVRRRCMLAGGGKDIIEEITAWMDNIGYEYFIVDGGAYRSFQARVRLQTVPDGILVQWTIDYKPKGVVGLLKDRLTGRRKLAIMMAESLRQLKRNVDQLGIRLDDAHRERVGIRGRLNADERAEYQRRHAPPPGLDPIGVTPEDTVPAVQQPPTDQLPAVQPPPGIIPTAGVAPSFVADLMQADDDADYSHTADTQPRKPEGLEEALSDPQADQPAKQPADQPAVQTADQPPMPTADPVVDHGRSDAIEPATAETIDYTPEPAAVSEPTPEAAPPLPTPTPPEAVKPVPAAPDLIIPPPPEYIAPPPPAIKPPAVESARADTAPPEPDVPDQSEPQPTHKSPSTPIHGMRPVVNTDELPTDERNDGQAAIERFRRPADPPPSAPRPSAEPPAAAYTPPPHPSLTTDAVPSREGLPPQTPKTDTGEISIWEVFGMPRPSDQDTQSLEELVQTVREREESERVRQTVAKRRRGYGKPRRITVWVRHYRTVEGLRRRLRARLRRVRRRP